MKFNPAIEFGVGLLAAFLIASRRHATWCRAGSCDSAEGENWRQYFWVFEISVATFAGYAVALSVEQLINCAMIAYSPMKLAKAEEIGISLNYTGAGSFFGSLLSIGTIVFLYLRHHPLCFRVTLNSDNCEIDEARLTRSVTEDIPPKWIRWEGMSPTPIVRAKFDRESRKIATTSKARVDATLVNDGRSYRVAVASKTKTADKELGDHVYVVVLLWVPV